jgi:hypothetical protein
MVKLKCTLCGGHIQHLENVDLTIGKHYETLQVNVYKCVNCDHLELFVE